MGGRGNPYRPGLHSPRAIDHEPHGHPPLKARGLVWTDVNVRDSLRVVTIAPFSRAYFDLVAARPALREALAIGTPVLIAGTRVNLKVADNGTTTWATGAMSRFLQEFDGR
jgi:hypothetical protein